jgi:pilus assembly protein CpaB
MTTFSQAQPRSGSRRQLWLAAVLGLLAAVLVIVFLNNVRDDRGQASVATTSVVVASRTIPVGEKLTEDMLVNKDLPSSSIPADAAKDRSALVGQIVRYPLEKGETLSASRLVEAPKVKSLSFQIPPGLRGMAIEVSEKSTPALLIAPGDFVDVIVSVEVVSLNGRSLPLGNTQREAKGAATIVQNVQVLSVDRNFANNGVVYDPSVRGTPPAEKDKVSFVTLAVNPEQAQLLWLAQDNGKLTVVLRAFGDDKVVPLPSKLEPISLP